MIQFELDYICDSHRHWLRDKRFGQRADFTERKLHDLDLSGRDLSNAIFDHAEIFNSDLSDANLTNVSASRTHFHIVDFTDATFQNAHLWKSRFTRCLFKNTDLWDVAGDGVYIISMQLGGKNICYTSEILQINCKQYDLNKIFWMTDEELLHTLRGQDYDEIRENLLIWWHSWNQQIQQIINKNPAKNMNIKPLKSK